MRNLPGRTPLAFALVVALAACSNGPGGAKGETRPKSAESAPTAEPGTSGTAYERAVRSLIAGSESGLHFASEWTGKAGDTQLASGVARGRLYSFSVRSKPAANPTIDGNWMSLNGFFQKEADGGYARTYSAPAVMTRVLDALPLLPTAQPALSGEPLPAESVAGVDCQPYPIGLATQPNPTTGYAELGVCVDEVNARIVRLSGSTFAGERFAVTFSEQDEPVQMPQAQVFDWSKEFPITEPGSEVPVKQFENCPDLIKMTPQGCEGYISAAPKAADKADPADKPD